MRPEIRVLPFLVLPFLASCLHAGRANAQSNACTFQYGAYAGGAGASVPDASGNLTLGFDDHAFDELASADTFDTVIPPLAPPGGWFVALSNPSDPGLFWGRADSRAADHEPGTEAVFRLHLYPRYAETGVDSVSLDWSGPCFTPPDVTVLSMAACDSAAFLVRDMTATQSVGIARASSAFWDDDAICLAIGARDDLVASVKLFLQGAFESGSMSVPPAFSTGVPLSQPYSDSAFDGTPLEFDSLETVDALPDSTVDWVLVALREAVSPESVVSASRHAALLLANGNLVEPDSTPLRFPGIAPGGYRLVVRHRNHLDAMSADTLDLSDGVGAWDFTTNADRAYSSGSSPQVSLGGGSYGLFAGDGNADGLVTALDFTLWIAETTAGATGYRLPDYNMDGIVTALDFTLWIANTTAGAASGVPE